MRVLLILLVLMPVVALAAADKPEPVALNNPGFEEELKGWDNADNPDLAGVFSLDGKVHHGGKSCLHMRAEIANLNPWVSQKVAKIEPGAAYVLKVWHQGGISPENTTYAAIRLEFLDAQGQRLTERYQRQRLAALQWQALGVEALAPPTAASAVVSLRLLGKGEAWFDDVELLRTKPALELVLRPDRMALDPVEGQTAHLEVGAAADLPKDAAAKVELLGPDDKPLDKVSGALAPTGARALAGDMTLPKLASGAYRWHVTVGKLEAWGKLFVTLGDRQPKGLTARGVLVLDGKPVFPIGVYHASVADYALLAQQGFNAAQGLGTHEVRLLRSSVDMAQKAGLMLEIPLHGGGMVGGNIVQSQQKLPYFAKSVGIAGWKVADEPDLHPEIADEVPEVYARLKERDKERPLGLTIERPETYAYWAHFCDSLQVVGFPLPGSPMTLVADRVEQAHKALQPWQHLSALLQAGWLPGGGNQPTLQQARQMVYLAVIHGARSIWWYALRDPGWKLAETKLWQDFKRLNEETAALGAAVIEGTEATVDNDNPALQMAAWAKGNQIRLAIVNSDAATAQTALVKLPSPVEQAAVSQGDAQVTVKDGAVQVAMPSGGVVLVTCVVSAKP